MVVDAITSIVALLLLLVLVVSTTTHHIAAWMLLVEVVVLSITMAGHTSLCSASTGWLWTATVYVLLYACSEYMHEHASPRTTHVSGHGQLHGVRGPLDLSVSRHSPSL